MPVVQYLQTVFFMDIFGYIRHKTIVKYVKYVSKSTEVSLIHGNYYLNSIHLSRCWFDYFLGY